MWYVYVPICIFILKVYSKLTCGMCKSDKRLINKVAIITGANTGIGFETAKDFALRGAKVILACRDEKKAKQARDKIIQETGNKDVIFKHLDLASLKSVRKFAEEILKTETKLDILVNNAGTGKLDNSLTEDNLPVEMQINYFGPFLLTNLLLPLLKSSAPSRIINVSSILHLLGTIDFNKIGKPADGYFQHTRVYSNSKLANILFTKELARRLEGTNVTVNALHPGAVNTDIFRDQYSILRFLIRLAFKTAWEGAQTTIYLAVSEEVEGVSGEYFSDCKQAGISKTARDENLAVKLWEVSERLVNYTQ